MRFSRCSTGFEGVLQLEVRRDARREPLFSLDPVDPANMETTTQKKRPSELSRVFSPIFLKVLKAFSRAARYCMIRRTLA